MVACLNPGEYQESVHTVSLAARSRHVTNFVSSAQKTTTPIVKVDMEAKLCAWLESKGKTKSTQKMAAFGSPFLCRTPSSVSSAKPSAFHSSTKPKSSAHKWASSLKGRHTDDSCRNLFDNGGFAFPTVKSLGTPCKEDTVLWKKTNAPVKLSNTPKKMAVIHEAYYDESSPVCGTTKSLQSSLRKVLSPINSSEDNMSPRDQSCVVLHYLKTPKTPFPFSCASNNSKMIGTPLDKFSVMSSNLKSSRIQEYIDVLNKASREELMELKGIGEKMAEYIVELRETSPLKSLIDLEKLGLSSKQVHNMFSRTVKSIFT